MFDQKILDQKILERNSTPLMRILGIDPGSRITGYGVIETDGHTVKYLDSGCIRTRQDAMPDRLRIIFDSVRTLVTTHQPDVLAIESVFMHRNAGSALKLGHARSAAICACVIDDILVDEYSPREIKLAIVGKGSAGKEQVQHMVTHLLNLNATPQEDAADALAVALCHSHTRHGTGCLGAYRNKGGRLR